MATVIIEDEDEISTEGPGRFTAADNRSVLVLVLNDNCVIVALKNRARANEASLNPSATRHLLQICTYLSFPTCQTTSLNHFGAHFAFPPPVGDRMTVQTHRQNARHNITRV